ncbi:MAG: hypothetical protein OEM22_01505 [Acidimicrobiia bacterium]|nr:hypothetical protein [Acidimicrobiia bacterium]MDH3469835.1 hypothetical protein [Acidimicrobiia bacterium]
MRASIAVVVLLVSAALPAAALADDSPDALGEDSPSAAQVAKVDLLADYVLILHAQAAATDPAATDPAATDPAATDLAATDLAATAARDSISALRDQGIGWGAIFKLVKLRAILGDTADVLSIGSESGEFDFGELKNNLTVDQLADYRAGVKNFGQLQKASKAVGADKAAAKANKKANKNQGGDE